MIYIYIHVHIYMYMYYIAILHEYETRCVSYQSALGGGAVINSTAVH